MDGRRNSALFNIGTLATLWSMAAFNGFQPAMVGISVLLSLEILLLAPVERHACAVRPSRLKRSVAEKAWWS